MSAKKTVPDALEAERDRNLLELQDEALDRIEAARSESNGAQEWRVHVTRIDGPDRRRNGTEARLFDCAIEELEAIPEQLKLDYGEGTYRIRVRLNRKNFQQWDVEIELSPAERLAFRNRVPPALPVAITPQAPIAAPGAGDSMTFVAQVMQQQTDMMGRLFERLGAPTNAPDPIAQFTAVATALQQLQAVQPKAEANAGLEMFERGMEFAERLSGAAGGPVEEGGLVGLLKGFLQSDAAKALVERIATPQPPAQYQPQHVQPAALPRVEQLVPAAAPAQGPIAMDQVGQAIGYLVGQAKQGAQPELFADSALQMIPPQLLDELETAEDMFGLLADRYPAIADHRPWFEALLNAMFTTEESAPPDAANTESAKPAAAAAG